MCGCEEIDWKEVFRISMIVALIVFVIYVLLTLGRKYNSDEDEYNHY